MLWPLSWDDNNWRSMVHTLGIYYHALTVVIGRKPLTEHGSYLRDILPCSDRCHETITTDGAWFIPKGYITMLWPLSWDDNNWQTLVLSLGICNHALTVVMRRWQLTEHGSYLRDILPCSDYCHETKTTDGAWFITKGYIPMLWPLSWDDNNWQSTVHTLGIYYHALTVVMGRKQLTEHCAYLRDILQCSLRCHYTITTVGAWFIP